MPTISTTSYTWTPWGSTNEGRTQSLDSALNGTLVGIKVNSSGTPVTASTASFDSANLTYTGKLVRETKVTKTPYKAILNGDTVWVNDAGTVVFCPSNSALVGLILCLVAANIVVTEGTSAVTTRAGVDTEISVSSLEPRDQFAMQALQGMMAHLDHPENFDDANIMSVCSAAYRWANGMLQAAADARKLSTGSGSGSGTSSVTVDTSSLSTNTEKLLNNIVASIDSMKTQHTTNTTNLINKLESMRTSTVHVDNPSDDSDGLQIAGGGGGTSLDPDDFKNNLDYNTLPRMTTASPTKMTNVVGFYQDANNKWHPGETTLETLQSLLESVIIASNTSKLNYLIAGQGGAISSISGFLQEYSQDIFNNQKSNWRADIEQAVNYAIGQLKADNSSLNLTVQTDYFDNNYWT